ncbi:hypothetical protein ACH5RR_006424 [Cinchona calisaya]|uniref:Ionotropic glutamate receptor C-terminal domain-containing protein n=1 Tax=Cinchona calisaya TaxID=153742 RepID=A0ABD3ANZ4_9GENT
MEGVLGLRPHVPHSKNIENFKAKWKRNAFLRKPESAVMELNMYGVVLRILEYEETTDTNKITSLQPRPREQHGLFFWFPISIQSFPERNMVANMWSRFLLAVWLFVAYILMQSYTAILSSIFKIGQLHFTFSDGNDKGYNFESFVKDYLINNLKFNESKLKDYTTIEEYCDDI